MPLLVGADAEFQILVKRVLEWMRAGKIVDYVYTHLLETFLRILLAIPVSEYLFGLLFGGIHGRNTGRIRVDEIREAGKRVRKVPDVAVCTSLAIVCLVYLLFIGIQGRYLFAAFAGTLPQEFTYAEYARRGFFELCRVGAWNLVFLGAAWGCSRTDGRECRGLFGLGMLLSSLTLLLLATALSKLLMYISAYGLTVNRILPFMFLLWLALVFALAILRQRKPFPMARVCVMAGAAMFSLLCVFPMEHLVSLYNAWARLKGYIV